MVLKDMLPADQYLLKAGHIIQMHAAVVHADPAFWDPETDDFNPNRSLNPDSRRNNIQRLFRLGVEGTPYVQDAISHRLRY